MIRQHISRTVKKIQIEILNYLKKKGTITGKIIWILNCVLILLFINFILKFLLNEYLNDFIVAITIISQFLIGIIFYHKQTNFFSFMDNLPILLHITLFLVLIIVYFLSISNIWKNKENYIKP